MENVASSIHTLVAASLAVARVACASRDLGPYSFPAQYRFMGKPSDYQQAPPCAKYGAIKTVDARASRAKVGVRYSQEGGPRYDVGMQGDVDAWLGAATSKAFTEARIGGGGSKTVVISLESVVTDESVFSRAEYDGTVIIKAKLGGFATSPKGFAEYYGYAGSAENHQETVNHALDKALAGLVNDPDFRKALCR